MKLKQLGTCIIITAFLTGCASGPHRIEQGLVKRSMMIKKEDIAAAVGAGSTEYAKSDAKSGAEVGAVVGLSAGPFAVFVSPVLAVLGGISGAIVGSTTGAIHGYNDSKNKFLYTYAVHGLKDNKLYLIHQYDLKPIPNNTRVNIYNSKGNIYYIVPIKPTTNP